LLCDSCLLSRRFKLPDHNLECAADARDDGHDGVRRGCDVFSRSS
jgi:hypothetical protein